MNILQNQISYLSNDEEIFTIENGKIILNGKNGIATLSIVISGTAQYNGTTKELSIEVNVEEFKIPIPILLNNLEVPENITITNEEESLTFSTLENFVLTYNSSNDQILSIENDIISISGNGDVVLQVIAMVDSNNYQYKNNEISTNISINIDGFKSYVPILLDNNEEPTNIEIKDENIDEPRIFSTNNVEATLSYEIIAQDSPNKQIISIENDQIIVGKDNGDVTLKVTATVDSNNYQYKSYFIEISVTVNITRDQSINTEYDGTGETQLYNVDQSINTEYDGTGETQLYNIDQSINTEYDGIGETQLYNAID